jgi:hypothetical protein
MLVYFEIFITFKLRYETRKVCNRAALQFPPPSAHKLVFATRLLGILGVTLRGKTSTLFLNFLVVKISLHGFQYLVCAILLHFKQQFSILRNCGGLTYEPGGKL